MCSKVVNGIEIVWDCGFPKPVTCGWRCEVCGQEAGGTVRYFDPDGDLIDPNRAKIFVAKGKPTEYFDRNGNSVKPNGW